MGTAAPAAPRVSLIDARPRGLDAAGLRAAARAQCSEEAFSCRTYRWPYALIAGWEGRIGIDIERIERDRTDRVFAESICTPSERLILGPRRFEPDVVASLWSGKEALAKALGDALAYDPRRLEAPLLWPEGRSGRWRARRLVFDAGHVVWVCWSVR